MTFDIDMTLPDPTITDLIDNAVMAMNQLVIHGLDLRTAGDPDLTDDRWNRIVEADHLVNSVQDAYDYVAPWVRGPEPSGER